MKFPKPPTDAANAGPSVDGGEVAAFLRHVYPGPRQSHKALSLWPLLPTPDAPPSDGLAYALLADALEDGFASVEEVGARGSVPHVRVENRAATAVLILFGEELRGAKQDRVANASFLLPPRDERVIDVSCVEQGRWGRRRGGFAPGAAAFEGSSSPLSGAIRRRMLKEVALSRARTGRYGSDQIELWTMLHERLARAGVHSESGAYADYARSRRADLDEIAVAFRVGEEAGQVGFVAAIGDAIVGLEAVGRAEVFARAFPRLLESYAIDAVDAAQLDASDESGAHRFESPQAFLDALADAPARAGASLGMGADLRVASEWVEGCALVAEGALVHLTAFPQVATGAPTAGGVTRGRRAGVRP
jgi:hypothetical protein